MASILYLVFAEPNGLATSKASWYKMICSAPLLIEKKIKAKQYILKEGDICKSLTFINSGCCRAFNIDNNGYEHILKFASQDYWVGDIFSFISQKPGVIFIQAMDEMEVLQIKKTDIDSLYDKIPKFERFFRIIVERAYMESQIRILNTLSLSAEERYVFFLENYIHLSHLIPQKQIALYLGITPEFFSRMKKRIKK